METLPVAHVTFSRSSLLFLLLAAWVWATGDFADVKICSSEGKWAAETIKMLQTEFWRLLLLLLIAPTAPPLISAQCWKLCALINRSTQSFSSPSSSSSSSFPSADASAAAAISTYSTFSSLSLSLSRFPVSRSHMLSQLEIDPTQAKVNQNPTSRQNRERVSGIFHQTAQLRTFLYYQLY